MEIKKYIITLKDRKDRIEKLNKFYNLNDVEYFFGYDKETLKKNKKELTTKLCNTFCTNSMVGCASSHIMLWNKILKDFEDKDDSSLALIIEDDTFLDVKKIDTFTNDFKELSINLNNNMIIYLTGEGIFEKKQIVFKDFILHEYYKTFFLGGYILTKKTLSTLVDYFKENKISYHIDFVIDQVFKKKGITPLIIKNKQFGKQLGQNDSNMFVNKNTFLNVSDNLNYALNFPIFKIFNIIINFIFIFFILFVLFSIITRNPFNFVIIGVLFFQILQFDF